MAKSRSFFGLRRGSTKSFTFSILGGQQITKDRVVEVKNPRTYAQQFQRAKFASMVKYFKQLPKGLLTYAYEDKKPTESYYNAFMRHNANRICTYLADQNAASGILATGDVEITAGTLGTLKLARGVITSSGGMDVLRFETAIAVEHADARTIDTVAKLSQILISGGYAAGDIVNVIAQAAPSVYGSQTAPYITAENPDDPTVDFIMSCIVDTSDNTLIESHFNRDVQGSIRLVEDGSLCIDIAAGDASPCINVAFIVSRKTSSGVKVTTSNMTCAEEWPVEKMRFDAYATSPSRPGAEGTNWTELVAQSYDGQEGNAILQGGLVTEGLIALTIDESPSTPATWNELSGKSITFNMPLDTPRSFYQVYNMMLDFNLPTGRKHFINGGTWDAAYVMDESTGKVCDVTISEDHKTVTFGSIEALGTTQVISIALSPVQD